MTTATIDDVVDHQTKTLGSALKQSSKPRPSRGFFFVPAVAADTSRAASDNPRMSFLGWLIRLAFFALVLWFALKNTTPVPLRFSKSLRYDEVPLILIILGCFVLGVLAGAAALAPRLFRLRRQAQAGQRATSDAAAAQVSAERYGDELASAARNAGAAGQLDADTRFPR
jgi:putative membrane protein